MKIETQKFKLLILLFVLLLTSICKATTWIPPASYDDPNSGWSNPTYAYDGNLITYARCLPTYDFSYLTLYPAAPVTDCNRIRVELGKGYYSIDVNYNSTWVNVYNGYNNTIKNWVVLPIGSTQTVSAVRIESTHAMIVYLFEMQFAQDHQIPTPVYAYPNKSINTTRNSQVLDSSNNLLSANTNRTQQVTSVGSTIPTFMSAQNTWPWCVDHVNYSSDAVICNNQTTPSLLEYTLDLENYSNICDMNITYATGDTNTMISYGSVDRIYDVNGTYYLQIGNSNSAYDDSNYSGIIFKSTDKGSTWTEILKTKYGMLLYNVVGNRIIAGEYHSDANDTNAGRNIYYSTDDGNTFVKIYNYGNFTANGYPNQFHNGYPIDDNTVYCGYGDQINSKIWKLTRPANWDGVSNWTLTEIAREQSPMCFCLQGNTLYITRDGGITNAFGGILKIDIASDTVEGTLHMAEPLSPGNYAPYSYQNALRSIGGIISYNGVLYTTFFNFSSVCNRSGFIASADGNNWTYLFRNPYVYGIEELCGVANIGGDDTLIGAYRDQWGNMRVIGVPIPNVMTNTAICVQKGFVNRLARINVGSVDDQWYKFDNTDGDGCGVQINALTGYGMQYSAYDMNNNPPGQFGGQIYFNDNWKWAGNYPNHNDLISLSFIYQTSPLFSAPTYGTSQETTWGCFAAGNMFYTDNTQTVLPMTTDWQPFNWWNEVNDQTDRSSRIYLGTSTYPPYAYRDGLYTNFDKICLIYSQDRWYQNPAPLMADCTGGTLVTANVADEYNTAALTGIGSSWSVAFSWYPMSGYLLYPYSATYPTLPIISICTNDSNYINLDWDRQNTQFKMTSSTSSVSLAPSNTISWVSIDCVKFIITCDGTDSTLYIWHPENYSVNNASNGILSVVGSGINLGSSIPASLHIGTDNLISNIGNGAYTNIMVWNTVLSADDVNAFFNMRSQSCDGTNYPRLFGQIPAADFVCPDGVDFADYSFFAEHWLNTNCENNNNCDGTDLDFSGMVDWNDLMIFCQQWLEGVTQ